jgi:hypothetical protein
MTKMMTALLALALSVPAVAFAQSTQTQQDQDQSKQNQAAENQVNGMNTMPHHTISGTISPDGKTFTTSDNKVYKVSNPNSVKDYANQQVSVEYQFNTESNTIHVNKVMMGQQQSQPMAAPASPQSQPMSEQPQSAPQQQYPPQQ